MSQPLHDASEPAADRPEGFTPDRLPDPWLFDSEYLLKELTRIRELALLVPVSTKVIDMHMPINTVIDAVWRLEETLRYLLRLHRDGQVQFVKKGLELDAAAPSRVATAERRDGRAGLVAQGARRIAA